MTDGLIVVKLRLLLLFQKERGLYDKTWLRFFTSAEMRLQNETTRKIRMCHFSRSPLRFAALLI